MAVAGSLTSESSLPVAVISAAETPAVGISFERKADIDSALRWAATN
jgi:hypothetical protein